MLRLSLVLMLLFASPVRAALVEYDQAHRIISNGNILSLEATTSGSLLGAKFVMLVAYKDRIYVCAVSDNPGLDLSIRCIADDQ